VPGATIRCGDDPASPEAVSDDSGEFTLTTSPGLCAVRVVANGFLLLRDNEVLAPGTATTVTYDLTPVAAGYETVVRGQTESVAVVKEVATRDEVQKVPGTFGDALRVIQDFPGVARAPYVSGALIVRGADPDQTQTLIDGVAVPTLYHLAGGPSVINTAFLDDIQFYPGGFGARYGRAIGGIVDVSMRKGAADTVHGEVKVDVLDTSVFVESPVTDKVSVAGAVRRSYIDTTLPLALNVLVPNSGLSIVPVYWDYQLRVDFGAPRSAPQSEKRNTFYVMAFGSDDTLKVATSGSSLAENLNLGVHTLFHRVKGDWTYHDGKLTSVFGPYLGYDLASGGFGAIQFSEDVYSTGAREDLAYQASPYVTLRAGVDVLFQHLSGSALLLPIPDVQYVSFPGAAPSAAPQSIKRTINGFDGAVYLEADFKLGRFTITPGLRPSFEREHGHDLASLDPRLWVRYQLLSRTELKGSVGLYSQPPTIIDLENAPFGTPTLGPEHAFQTSLGVDHKFSDIVSLAVTGFFNRRYDLIVQPGATVVNPDGSVTENLYSNLGVGRAYGVEVLLRHRVTERFFGWIAYTLSRSIVAQPGVPYQLSTYDETHILTLIGSYRLPKNWEVGLRFRYVTGRPYTQVLHPYDQYNVDANAFSPLMGGALSARNPPFNQLDLRVEKDFLFRHFTLGVYLDIQNVYNATNQEAVLYDYRFRMSEALPGIPFLPVLGVRGTF
jgi:hypothetical protein